LPVVKIGQPGYTALISTGAIGYHYLGFGSQQMGQMLVLFIPNSSVEKTDIYTLIRHLLYISILEIQAYRPEHNVGNLS
jgi:NH3-dependent NAD+ synthetase